MPNLAVGDAQQATRGTWAWVSAICRSTSSGWCVVSRAVHGNAATGIRPAQTFDDPGSWAIAGCLPKHPTTSACVRWDEHVYLITVFLKNTPQRHKAFEAISISLHYFTNNTYTFFRDFLYFLQCFFLNIAAT